MEEGKKYRIFYDDGERVRDKNLIFKKSDDGFLIFYNPQTMLEESIPRLRIVRMEGVG
jgi:hypothetical protein